MSILVDRRTIAIVQGITGKEGLRAAREMRAYGTRVVAGVTPGKGGITVQGDIPVFESVAETRRAFPRINLSLIAVPAAFALDAALEAIYNKIALINILTENIPTADAAQLIYHARREGVRIVGPSSVGIISPGKGKAGSIGSSELVHKVFTPGPVGVISKSGGMTAEISYLLTKSGLGQSTVVGIGGDMLVGSDFADIALEFERDPQTKVLVIFGEVGGTYEERLAEAIRRRIICKPVVALIGGRFSAQLPQDTVLGHAGAIVHKGKGSISSKINSLGRAGGAIAETIEDVPRLVTQALAQEPRKKRL